MKLFANTNYSPYPCPLWKIMDKMLLLHIHFILTSFMLMFLLPSYFPHFCCVFCQSNGKKSFLLSLEWHENVNGEGILDTQTCAQIEINRYALAIIIFAKNNKILLLIIHGLVLWFMVCFKLMLFEASHSASTFSRTLNFVELLTKYTRKEKQCVRMTMYWHNKWKMNSFFFWINFIFPTGGF